MNTEDREAAWFTEAVTSLIASAGILPIATVRTSLEDLRRIADEDPDPTTGGALMRICDAIEGVCEDV